MLTMGLAFVIGGCYDVEKVPSQEVTVAQFDPAPVSPSVEELVLPAVPQPSNLLMEPSPQNPELMKVSLPVQMELTILGRDEPHIADAFSTETAKQMVESYLNTLYGFTTDVATETSFKGIELEEPPADSFRVLELSYDAEGKVTGVTTLQTAVVNQEDFDPDTALWNIDAGIVPILVGPFQAETGVTPVAIHPPNQGTWTQGSTYAALITTDITDVAGKPVVSSYVFNLLKGTEPLAEEGRSLCALPDADAVQLEAGRSLMMDPIFQFLESDAAADNKISREEIALAWTLTIRPGSIAINDPTKSLFPTPNDIVMFSPASSLHDCDGDGEADCTEGHLCFPVNCEEDTPAQKGFFQYMNSLDGWPASTPLSAAFTLPLEREGVTSDSVSLHQLGADGAEAVENSVSLDESGTTVGITPEAGYEAGGKYAAVVTTGLMTKGGTYEVRPSTITAISKLTEPVVTEEGSQLLDFDVDDETAVLLEGIRQGIDALVKAVELDESRANIAAIWGFTIQSHNEAIFDPTSGQIPFPNEVLMALDDDGNPTRVNIPIDPGLPDSQKDIYAQMNMLDGFSPLASTRTRFLRPLDESTFHWLPGMDILLGSGLGDEISLGMADITTVDPTKGVGGMLDLMDAENIYTDGEVKATFENGSLVVRPEPGKPFPAGRRLMLIVFDNLKSEEQGPDEQPYPIEVAPVFFMARNPHPLYDEETETSNLLTLTAQDAQQLEMLRAQYNLIFGALESEPVNVPRERILMFWTFATQTIGEWLLGVKKNLMTLSVGDEPTGTLKEVEAADVNLEFAEQVLMNGKFTAYSALAIPDFSAEPPVAGRMQFDEDGNPVWSQYSLPYILLLPKKNADETPAPVVILQHGLNGNKEMVLSQADRFLEAGYAVVAIDLVLHGARAAEGEESGYGFFTADAVATRDHIVQSALDIAQLTHFVTNGLNKWIEMETGDVSRIDSESVHLVGNSLGGIAGTLTLSVVDEIDSAALVVTGGHLTRILEETPDKDFKQPIVDSLMAMGYEPETPEYEQFMDTAQMLLDRGDPVNYARHLVRKPLDSAPDVTMSKKKIFILLAQNDGLIPEATSMELACAAREGVQPYTKTYADMCHGFFFKKCGGGDGLDERAKEAAEDILLFLADGGSAENVVQAVSADTLDCDNL